MIQSTSREESQSGLHVAIIMDGNGRWAAARGLPRLAGHRRGAAAVRRVVQAAPGLGIGTLTLYAFSTANWKRPPHEVSGLMRLCRRHLDSARPALVLDGVRLTVIGRRDRLPPHVLAAVIAVEAATAAGQALRLRIAIDYSARDTIVHAARRLEGAATREAFARRLGHAYGEPHEAPDVDLLIRTGGEQRLSDFLLWECAYAELYFTDRMWPDFNVRDLAAAVCAFSARERRFGGLRSAEAALPGGEGADSRRQIAHVEVRPHAVGEVELGVRALPQQEIREPLLASGANQQVDVRRLVRLTVRMAEPPREGLAGRGALQAPGGVNYRVPRGIVDGDPEPQRLPRRRRRLDGDHRGQHEGRTPITPAEDGQSHTVPGERGPLAGELAPEQSHQAAHFVGRALPVVRRERIEGQRPDAEPGRGLDDPPHRRRAAPVASQPWQPSGGGPAPVAVHDDGHVKAALAFFTRSTLHHKVSSHNPSPAAHRSCPPRVPRINASM